MMTFQELIEEVIQMPDESIMIIWNNLRYLDPRDKFGVDISSDDWAQLIYCEKSKRGLD